MEIKHGFLETKWTEQEKTACSDGKCPRSIENGDTCFLDIENNAKVYCKNCGCDLRYQRKMEKVRIKRDQVLEERKE